MALLRQGHDSLSERLIHTIIQPCPGTVPARDFCLFTEEKQRFSQGPALLKAKENDIIMILSPPPETKEKGKIMKIKLIWLSVLLLLLSFSACAEPAAGAPDWQAYSGKRIGVQVGTTSEQQVEARIPDAVLLYDA